MRRKGDIEHYPKLIRACYTDEALGELDRLRAAVQSVDDGSDTARLTWLTLVSILRRCSHVGTAQWQYVLPKKSKKGTSRPFQAFDEMCRTMLADMEYLLQPHVPKSRVTPGRCAGLPGRARPFRDTGGDLPAVSQ